MVLSYNGIEIRNLFQIASFQQKGIRFELESFKSPRPQRDSNIPDNDDTVKVCHIRVSQYCQGRGIESLYLIERLWKEEVCREKENLSEMFLVFKQLLRRRGRVANAVESSLAGPLHLSTPTSPPIFLWNLKKRDFTECWTSTTEILWKIFLFKCTMCIFCLKCKVQQENSVFIGSE